MPNHNPILPATVLHCPQGQTEYSCSLEKFHHYHQLQFLSINHDASQASQTTETRTAQCSTTEPLDNNVLWSCCSLIIGSLWVPQHDHNTIALHNMATKAPLVHHRNGTPHSSALPQGSSLSQWTMLCPWQHSLSMVSVTAAVTGTTMVTKPLIFLTPMDKDIRPAAEQGLLPIPPPFVPPCVVACPMQTTNVAI